LLSAADAARARVLSGWRVQSVARDGDRFVLSEQGEAREPILAREVILATGGRSLPRSGSDGHGYAIARSLGHSITPRVLPALVPLTLAADSPLRALQGVAAEAQLAVIDGAGRRLAEASGAVLCAHFGISGPAVLDISRHWLHARLEDASVRLEVNWLPGETPESLDARLVSGGAAGSARVLSATLPSRLAAALCLAAGVDPAAPCARLEREARRRLARLATRMELPVTGDRGFTYAEVTAGGVPLAELHLDTMRSRLCPGLLICGEICDVDGRIGGFNFQWAWASGCVAGVSAGA
jgi:predicted Rossmann fold flavoprotein